MGRIAFVFPGQGAQYVGMGADIARMYPTAAKIFEKAGQRLGYNLHEIIMKGPEKKLMETKISQPAILATEWAICSALLEKVALPDCTAGLSLGEYTAHLLAGSLEFEESINLVEKRGLYMQEEVPLGAGGMSAILGLDKEIVQRICEQVSNTGYVACANYNYPGQIVISGEIEAVEKAGEILKENGAKRVIPLSVSAPFHCELLKGAGDKLALELKKIKVNDMKIPVYANVTGEVIPSKENIRELLERQVSQTVKWTNIVHNMIESGVDTFVEVGPGKILSGLIKKNDRSVNVINVMDVETFESACSILERV